MLLSKSILLGTLAAALVPAQSIVATPATRSGEFARPQDATPDPDGVNFYFTAIGPNGAGVFRVPSAGGQAIPVVTGAPFVFPTGISISSDGASLYVTDPLAYAGAGRIGQVFTLPAAGGAVRSLRGAEGLQPRSIEVVGQGASDVIYFSGKNSKGQPAIYRLAPGAASEASVIAEGDPFSNPDGIAVTRAGITYVADRGAYPGDGRVYKIAGSTITTVVETMRAGDPAGIALSQDESTLLVSTLQPYRTRAQVLIVDTASLETQAATAVVGENPGAGGLHRARNSGVMAWCGIGAGGGGTVYIVTAR